MNDTFMKRVLKNLKLNESSVSTVLGLLVVLVLGSLILNFFRQNNQQAASTNAQPDEVSQVQTVQEGEIPSRAPETYKVQAGDNLWKIAETIYGSGYNWIDLAKANNLKAPYVVTQNQDLKVVKVASKKLTIKQLAAVTDSSDKITGETYKIQKGDTLWKIAVRAYGDGYQWPKIAQANKLINPAIIHIDNSLIIPR